MDLNEHASLIGQLIGNFHSLECALRLVIFNNQNKAQNKEEVNLNNFSEGDIVEEDAFTDYSTLGELIQKYNNIVKNNPSDTVDPNIVHLRDALAHGRVFSCVMQTPLKLLKFDKPKNGKVNVTFAQNMTDEWLKNQIDKVYKELMKVAPFASKPRNNFA